MIGISCGDFYDFVKRATALVVAACNHSSTSCAAAAAAAAAGAASGDEDDPLGPSAHLLARQIGDLLPKWPRKVNGGLFQVVTDVWVPVWVRQMHFKGPKFAV